MQIKLPIGTSDFLEIRKNGYYYIDKTNLIREILNTTVTLITRPRRFGKTLGMSMLANFFDIRKDSKELFEGLEITKDGQLCNQWMNQYPVLFLSFKDVDGRNFENAYALLKFTIAQFCDEHEYLERSEAVTQSQKEIFNRLKTQTASMSEIQTSLYIIMKMMKAHYGRPVILLLDEYDVPIAKASSKGYYEEMLEIVKAMLSTSLKDNTSLKLAVVTGCLKIAKESIFTGTNNFVSDTIHSSRLNEYFGFMQEEVDKLLEDLNARSYATCIKEWYDGYHFGDYDIYCPWDVMNYLREVQYNPKVKPASYWKNTSDNAIIRSFIDYAGSNITMKLETLLTGGYIIQHIEENLTYDYLHSSEENLWSILYLTGYLTKARDVELPDELSALVIPNAEIKDIFESTVKKWFEDYAKTCNRKPLCDAVGSGDFEFLTKEISKLLQRTISYHDYREDFYHAFLVGIFTGAGYMVKSNREHGEGRSDIVVYDSSKGRVAIFEVKYAKELKKLSQSCKEAINQIQDKKYAKEFEEDYYEVLCYGIAFYKKRCMVRKQI